jgi:outer membrane receptor protein involved in Fe transport
VKVIGAFSIPKAAIKEMSVLTGGIPAQFGDATGGIIIITTKGYVGW